MTPHDIPTDEIRRQLRAIDRANATAMPRWREALTRILSGEEQQLTADDKAAILGVPTPGRRNLFKLGSASIIGAAVLAACGDDNDDTASTGAGTGTGTGGTTATTGGGSAAPGSSMAPGSTAAGGGAEMDVVLAKTAASLEKLAVDTYGAAGGLLETQAIIDAATMFADHHQQHLDALNGVITGAGAEAVTEMNQAVYDALIKPAIDAAESEMDAVMLAVQLEEAAAQTYVFAGGTLSTPELRSTIMTIGGVEARHAVVLRMAALQQGPSDIFPEERAFFPSENPLAGIDGALITD